jgi:hypothetical protein
LPSLPNPQPLLALWERGEREHPIDRTLSVLAAVTQSPRRELAALPVHRRDALLLASRAAAFGNVLDGVTTCQACGCRIDVAFELPDLSGVLFADQGAIDADGGVVSFRVPDSCDLAAALQAADMAAGREVLIDRCILAGPANAAARQAIEDQIELLCDPAWLELRLPCPECPTEFVVPIDIGRFFWEELSAYAERLIDETSLLAAHFGWAEADILALPERRRQRYLERLL